MSTRNRAIAALVVMVVALALTLWAGTWPEIYTFATNQQASLLRRLATAPIHLSDDVMITLRTGRVLLETGTPSFNHSDLAQASTSYVMPYVFAALAVFLSSSTAVAAFAGLGLVAVTLSLGAIVYYSRSTSNGVILALALALTTTNLQFALNGWDHLFQGFVFVVALAMARMPSEQRFSPTRLILIGALLAIGSLIRPDGLLIALAILLVLVSQVLDRRRVLVLAGVPFAGIGAAMLALNLWQFGHLLPTTTRLKLGSAPTRQYVWDYALANSIGSYTAFTVLIVLLVFVLVFRRALPMRSIAPIAIAATVTAGVATYNSDVFAGGRMYWVPAITLAMIVAMDAPSLVAIGAEFRVPSRIVRFGALAMIVIALGAAAVAGVKGAVISKEAVANEGTVNQFELAQWANENLNPANGPIGVFYAGVSYHLPTFEIADFLGKGDELIAATKPKLGLPGHNKWDINATLDKWHPQAIFPTLMVDIKTPDGLAYAKEWLAEQWNHAYLADLFLDPQVQQDYRMCSVKDINGVTDVEFGILLRNDVAVAIRDAARCLDWQ